MASRGDRLVLDYAVVKDADGWFIATIPALPGCITASKVRSEISRKIREAAVMHLEHFVETKGVVEFVGMERLEL